MGEIVIVAGAVLLVGLAVPALRQRLRSPTGLRSVRMRRAREL